MMDRLRARYAEPDPVELDALSDGLSSTDSDSAVEVMKEGWREELALLPAVERETLTLFYLGELSLAEVADVQGVPVGTVKSRLHRSRRMLRDRMHAARDDAGKNDNPKEAADDGRS
jgi:RNA polymerase sigma-70 factor (ECF subfamily)